MLFEITSVIRDCISQEAHKTALKLVVELCHGEETESSSGSRRGVRARLSMSSSRTLVRHVFDVPEEICYVQCGLCSSILVVSVPCTSMSMAVLSLNIEDGNKISTLNSHNNYSNYEEANNNVTTPFTSDSAPNKHQQVSLHPLTMSIQEFASAAKQVDDESKLLRLQETAGDIVDMKKQALNDRLILAKKGFLDADGLHGRQWFKHLVFGRPRDKESKLDFFPGIADSNRNHQRQRVKEKEKSKELATCQGQMKTFKLTEALKNKAIEELRNEVDKLKERLGVTEDHLK
ncbi:hypothetical protein Ahy_A05g022041 isoform D [Arachis hypogaea]|uniref:Uncharacterized protein n=1 Tax=Arachis hypogaea TaxID=3818 RepID=A0A445CZE1_ARAHY|nr:hypothetical protein Ahy_A05g022041 isoform D [Arachis hypogaea]